MVDKLLDELTIERDKRLNESSNLRDAFNEIATYNEGFAEGLEYAIRCIQDMYNG